MEQYLDICRKILKEGTRKHSRTGMDTLAIAGAMFEHDMENGFPLLTTKKMYSRVARVELEGFINGITDKSWYQERQCFIWDEWCSPTKVPYGHDKETQEKMKLERDLGPIYGFQWRHFGAEYKGYDHNYTGQGIDQLANIIDILKTDPDSRRMVVTAWNATDVPKMALSPCHDSFQVNVTEDKLNLIWRQRSVDVPLGLPFNMIGYGLMLQFLAKETGFKEGKLIGQLGDVHIYENQLAGIEEQISRKPYKLPQMVTENFTSIFDWKHTDTKPVNYKSHEPIKFEVSV